MHQISFVCALTLSVIAGGYRLDWDPTLGPASPVFLRNHPSAFAEASFVSAAVAAGVAARTMRACAREDLVCILPLGVAANSAGKLRLIWDGRHVNRHLLRRRFRMETLQREGRALFERSLFGGTADISAAYHHVEMAEESLPFLGFEWGGQFYRFEVLPFGLSTAPFLFTTVMGHSVRFLRSVGVDLIAYLDDLIFAHGTAHGAVSSARRMVHILGEFGWLVHPTKCVGLTEAVQSFKALGTIVDLATQMYSVPPDTVARILAGIESLMTGPPSVGVRTVAKVKGLLTSTWVSTGPATRVRTRELDRVIASREQSRGASRRERRAAWSGVVILTADCLAELAWWARNLGRINGSPIRVRPLEGHFDSVIESDASDTGVGAVVYVSGLAAASSALVAALLALAPRGVSRRTVLRQARRGLEFMAALPAELLAASSTLREMHGIVAVIEAVAHLLSGGRHRVIMDNLGAVFINGGVVPAFAVGGKAWGEFVSGGSPNPALQRLAVRLLDIQLDRGFTLVFEWVPRDLNVRADFLSHASEEDQHDYSLREELFAYLDGLWGPHSVDRFASAASRQPLLPPNRGRFCSRFFHPEAEWTNAFTIGWGGENNWVFPPIHLVGEAIRHMRASGAAGTLIAPEAPWSPWWASARAGRRWAPDIVSVARLGPAPGALLASRRELRLFGGAPLIAFRLVCRGGALSGREPEAGACP